MYTHTHILYIYKLTHSNRFLGAHTLAAVVMMTSSTNVKQDYFLLVATLRLSGLSDIANVKS